MKLQAFAGNPLCCAVCMTHFETCTYQSVNVKDDWRNVTEQLRTCCLNKVVFDVIMSSRTQCLLVSSSWHFLHALQKARGCCGDWIQRRTSLSYFLPLRVFKSWWVHGFHVALCDLLWAFSAWIPVRFCKRQSEAEKKDLLQAWALIVNWTNWKTEIFDFLHDWTFLHVKIAFKWRISVKYLC